MEREIRIISPWEDFGNLLLLRHIFKLVQFLFQFFLDGVMSISTMLCIAVYYLAQNPEMQERAYEEIQVRMASSVPATFYC